MRQKMASIFELGTGNREQKWTRAPSTARSAGRGTCQLKFPPSFPHVFKDASTLAGGAAALAEFGRSSEGLSLDGCRLRSGAPVEKGADEPGAVPAFTGRGRRGRECDWHPKHQSSKRDGRGRNCCRDPRRFQRPGQFGGVSQLRSDTSASPHCGNGAGGGGPPRKLKLSR